MLKSKNYRIYIMSFLLPIVVLLSAMWIKDVFPMGKTSVLLWDLEIQYIDLFAWFRNALHNGEGLFYSFSKSLGGNMFGIFSLYLTSPLNFLIYFFEVEDIPAFFSIITILKLALAGLTMSIFLNNRVKIKNKAWIVIFSSAYALLEYNIAFCSNIHFLDAIYMMPLAALGVWRLVNNRKRTLLYISVSYVIICNWYIGYMVCLFSIFDFIFEYYLKENEKSIKDFFKQGIEYGITMFLGVMTSLVFFLPAALSAMNGKGSLSLKKLVPDFHVNPLYPLRALFITSPTNTEHGLPAIYVSYIIVILCVVFFVDKEIAKKVKRAFACFLLFVFISFSFVPFEIMWTDFKETYSFHHRYAFVFGFLLIFTAAFYIAEVEKKRHIFEWKHVLIAASLLSTMFVAMDLVRDIGNKKELSFTIGIIILYSYIIVHLWKFENKNKMKFYIGLGLLCLIFIAEQVYNVSESFTRYNITLDEYKKYAESMKEDIRKIGQDNSPFYRIEKTFCEMSNRRINREPAASEGFVYQYNGLTHYSSSYDSLVNDFLTKLGYCKQDAMAVNYVENTFLTDSILGIKYIVSDVQPAGFEKVSKSATSAENYIFENECALNFGTKCSEMVQEFKWGNNPFDNIQNMFNVILGENNRFFEEFDSEITNNKEVSWNIEVSQSGPVYAYFNCGHKDADIYVDGQYKQSYFGRFYKNVLYLGEYEKGEIINLELDSTYDKGYKYNLVVVGLNEKLAKQKLEQVQKNSFIPDKVEGGYVHGFYEADSNVKMVLQTPYDEGWKIWNNGKEIPYNKVFDGLIQIEMEKGINEITMKYLPPGFCIGMCCSILGIFIYIGWNIIERIINKKK